ncbi:MAG TPA: class I SAM-dependent methyltransferase [Candidatus Limnocylindria bacterium]|nr:class I SAM-dependent methyltransferase [Candidatus Limnocylindria bacterium]
MPSKKTTLAPFAQFTYRGKALQEKDGSLTDGKTTFPVRDGIPRFTPDQSYSTGNFSKLRENHATLQLDSINGTTDRLNTILNRTRWPRDFFKGKTVLECGCGAGPDTEILLDLGAKVVSVDIAGVDIAKRNLSKHPRADHVQFVQDSIANLHLKPQSFDVVFCHRVLQHTPDPAATLKHILQFVKKDGYLFVHSYSSSRFQMRRWKYALLPFTNKLPPVLLYKIIQFYAWPTFYLTNFTNKTKLGARFNHIFVPFLNYRSSKKFSQKSNKFIVEYGVHDTFDALSPPYDQPLTPEQMEKIAQKALGGTARKFDVYKDTGMTLLRTKL